MIIFFEFFLLGNPVRVMIPNEDLLSVIVESGTMETRTFYRSCFYVNFMSNASTNVITSPPKTDQADLLDRNGIS